jgi:hypothetical protein
MARRESVAATRSRRVAEDSAADTRPLAPVRRFDVFAEFKRLEAARRGATADEAHGYGIWVAKVVAGRRFGGSGGGASSPGGHRPRGEASQPESAADGDGEHPERMDWGPRELNGEPQTAATFEREIVRRMGAGFYREVFGPAVRAAFEGGERYEQVRDVIRAGWKP